jgi:hypothetical protein
MSDIPLSLEKNIKPITARELLALPREERLMLLRDLAAEAQSSYASDVETAEWAEFGIEDIRD